VKLRSGIALTTYFVLILFVTAPLPAILISIILVTLSEKKKYLDVRVAALLLSLFLGSINATKLPESDLLNFYGWLSLAQDFSLTQYIVLFGKEPLYFLWIYLIGNFPGINGPLFALISTAVVYFAFFLGLISLGRAVQWPEGRVLVVIVFISVFSPLFNASAHLMREFMAGAAVSLYFVRGILGYRSNLWVLFLAALIHSTAAVFIPFALISRIKNLPQWAIFALVAVFYLSLYILAQTATTYLVQIPLIGYVFGRFVETTRDVYVLGPAPILFAAASGFGALFINNIVRLRITPTYRPISSPAVREFSASVILLSVFIIVLYLRGDSMYPIRFLLYLYFLIGILLFFLQAIPIIRFITTAMSYSILPVLFFYNLAYGIWSYASLDHILFYPFIFNF